MGTARRELGATERNWVLTVAGGTGISVSAFLFGLSLSKASVQAAVSKLLLVQPYLRSQIVSVGNSLYFEISESTVVVEEFANPFVGRGSGVAEDEEEEAAEGEEEAAEDEEEAAETWLRIVDHEMGINFPEEPTPVFQVHLYGGLPDDFSLVVLRAHSSAVDMVGTGSIGSEFLNSLKEVVQQGEEDIEEFLQKITLDGDSLANFEYYESIEKSIPAGGADRPFWGRAVDIVGYGMVSRMQAYMPFRNTQDERKSHLLRASLSKEASDRLLEACEKHSTDLYGAVTAAGLKSIAAFKKVGNRGEHYGVAVFHDCREVLHPKLSKDSLGFFQSALLLTEHTSESLEYWELAAASTKDFKDAITSKKHFTHMGSLNMLMVQAIHHPNLTPYSTMRTATVSILHDPVIETTPAEMAEVLQLKDFVSASSITGVGPCLGFFQFLRDGALHLSVMYCSPLFTRHDIQALVDSIVGFLTV